MYVNGIEPKDSLYFVFDKDLEDAEPFSFLIEAYDLPNGTISYVQTLQLEGWAGASASIQLNGEIINPDALLRLADLLRDFYDRNERMSNG